VAALSDIFGLAGNVIDGQFHVLEVIGEGGFSVVYKGQHLGLREPVAIKCLKINKTKDPTIVASFTQRFFDESRISYRLSQGNLNIVRSITSGTTISPRTKDTVPYMVLEWLEGESLAADFRLRRMRKQTGRSLAEVMQLFEPAAMALAYAHAQGIAHRDVKPGNLFSRGSRAARPS
jgi:serine/threonine protein kinase